MKVIAKTKKTNKKSSKTSEEKISHILNSIGEAVVTLDRHFIIQTFNPVAEQLSGYKLSEAIGQKGQNVLTLVDEEGKRSISWPFSEVIKRGKTIKLTNHSNLLTKGKRILPISFNISPLRDDNNKIIGLILVFRDVTKEREVQRMKSEFVSIVSHQLRTPSSAVKWYLETLLDNKKGNKINTWQLEHLQQAYQSNERMIALINDLLNVSRLESGRLKMNFTKVQITDICNSVISEMENFARANNVGVVCKIKAKAAPLVKADSDKIRQVIQNIINNAIKYTRPGKQTVIVDAKQEKNFLKIWVKDHGMGIPKEQRKRMFERFFRAENAIISQTEGSGLGLYIAKQIINLHHGNIWMESKEGKGSTFYITLPIYD
jgi:PAS domain S-box-containing protein